MKLTDKANFNRHSLTPGLCIALALMVWAVFSRTLHHQFVNYDDNGYVYENPAIIKGIGWAGIKWAFTHSHGHNWHPLTTLSHMVDCSFYGVQPAGHHRTNLLLHGLAAICLFLMIRSLTGALWRSALLAALFAVHPLRVESVAWVAERKDVLSGVFFMLTLWAYGCYAHRSKIQGAKAGLWYGVTLVLFALGLLSKPMLVTVPFVLLLLDFWPLRRFPTASAGGLGRLFLEKIPFLLLAAADCLATVWAQKGAIKSVETFDLASRMANAVTSYIAYIGQLFIPINLAVLYPHPGKTLPGYEIWGAGVLLLAVTAAAMSCWRKYPYVITGWLWYLDMLVPVIGILQVGDQARADRYTYLPQIGLVLMLVWGATDWCAQWRHGWLTLRVAASLILVGLALAARAQTNYWQDSISLWSHTLACTSNNSEAHNFLGGAFSDQGRFGEAVPHFQAAVELDPDYAQAHGNLGVVLAKLGRTDEAIQHDEQALQLDPDNAVYHNNLGQALAKQNRMAAAAQQFTQAIQLQSDLASAHYGLGLVLIVQNKVDEGVQHLNQASALATAQGDLELLAAIRKLAKLNQPAGP